MPDQDCFSQSGDVSSQNVRWTDRWPRRRTIVNCEASKGPLFTRFYLFESLPLSIYVHCFHTSDDDRNMHDHPWPFLTIPLSGGYWDVTPAGRQWVRRFRPTYRPAAHRHIVILDRPNTWTLVFRFRRVREWGFWTDNGWLDWRSYGKLWCD